MSGETPTALLREQHRRILRIADLLEEILERGRSGDAPDFDAIAECVTFVRLYADALHHGKEEELLFPELEAAGMQHDRGPIAVMLREHAEGRALARAMADALPAAREGDETGLRRLTNAAHDYVALIRGHILKEDHILFEMADQMISGPACRRLCEAYDDVCARRFEGCAVADLERILERLAVRYPIA